MENFESTLGRLMIAHAQVKSIPVAGLSATRADQRSKQLITLRNAIARLVTKEYSTLSTAAQGSAQQLDAATIELNQALATARTGVQVINAVAAFVRVAVGLLALI